MTVPVTQSVKIDMTAPVTQSKKDGKLVMQFYLPSKFTINTAPKPTNRKVSLVVLEGCLLYTSPSPRDATLSRVAGCA